MGALDPDVLTWLWLVPAAVAATTAVAVRRWRLAAVAVGAGALTGWLAGLSGGSVAVQAIVAVVVATTGATVAARYRALVRRGSGLPPGTGGGRLVGMTGTITHHDGAGNARVSLLGDEWRVAGQAHRLVEGDRVRVTGVEGVALVVTRVPASGADPRPDPRPDPTTHETTRPQPQDGVT